VDQLANVVQRLPRWPRARQNDRQRRGRIGNGYGSECHLLRYLGRHRSRLDAAVMRTVPCIAEVRWLDFHFDPKGDWPDGERKALDFLDTDHPARIEWGRIWPHRGTPIHWDAVGRVKIGSHWEWLLVEAKAHLGEVLSSCGAEEDGGRPLIRKTLDRVKSALGVDEDRDWLDGYYQYCNRIAMLHHLVTHDALAQLLWIYFTGDRGYGSRVCPKDELGWREALVNRTEAIGLPERHALSARMHKLFLPVCPNT
jgi:hypothetical protein